MHAGEQELCRVVCLRSWNRTRGKSDPSRARNRGNSWVRLCGPSGSPSARAHNRVAPVWRTPSINSLSACSRLSRPTSSTANEGRVIARARSVFGDLNFNPFFVCSRLSTMRTVPRSRSTFRQRSARTSPRRAPVASASRTGQKMCECRTASRSRADRSAVKVSRAAGSHRRALAGRVGDWRAGLGRCRATSPVPSTSNAACGFVG
jgi:hypothetical protein